ncbi:MAG: hypothetical protein IJ379_00915 [Lachnospiraceae bacterium]|nr:hypothetical protein [Lachnospiraceae bacterium]
MKLNNTNKKKKHTSKKNTNVFNDSDETFAFIAGTTSWGFLYGITWEELEGEEEISSDEELPFN